MQNGCENRPHGTGILRPGSVVRVPFRHEIASGTTESHSIAPPGEQTWRLLDIVTQTIDEAAGFGAPPTVQLQDVLDGSGNSYLPKVGDRTNPLAEVSPQVKVRDGSELGISRVNTFPGGRSQGPVCTFDKPLSSSNSPCQILWNEYAGAGAQTVVGYYEFRVVA